MALDEKNMVRLDLQDIFDDAVERSYHICQALDAQSNGKGFSPDVYAISGNEYKLLFRFITAGAAKISNYASMVKHYTQTGIDALTYYEDLEKPEDADSYVDPDSTVADDEYITGPDGNQVLLTEIMNKTHDTGEKLSALAGDTITFLITDFDGEQYRYTVIQQFIRDCLVEYALYEWWKHKGVQSQAAIHFNDYEKQAGNIRFNSVINHKRKGTTRRIGPVF